MTGVDHDALARLADAFPLPAVELERRLDAVCSGLDPRAAATLSRRARIANAHARLLTALPAPAVPRAELDRRVLGSLHEGVVADSESRLRDGPLGDLIAAGFAPVAAPAEVDWATAAVEELLSRSNGAADRIHGPAATPGWLWARIRSELQAYRGGLLARARRAPRAMLTRAGLAAATIAITALLVHVLWTSKAPRPDDISIQFVRVDRPLSAGFAPAEIARRVRDGRE